MGNGILENLPIRKSRSRRKKKEKKNIILTLGVSIFIMGVFFYPAYRPQIVLADNGENAPCEFKKEFWCGILVPSSKISAVENNGQKKPESLNELKPEKNLGTFVYEDSKEKNVERAKASLGYPKKSESSDLAEQKITELVAGHPLEGMALHIAKRKKEVASYLVAIAKKESNWGKHSPKKSGRDCYNYWGYKGGYNLTPSGYSCFDSPEQAVQVVGDRIEDLLNKKIDTPSRMVVWKCGSTCKGHDPAGVAKWISDVALYYQKLNS